MTLFHPLSSWLLMNMFNSVGSGVNVLVILSVASHNDDNLIYIYMSTLCRQSSHQWENLWETLPFPRPCSFLKRIWGRTLLEISYMHLYIAWITSFTLSWTPSKNRFVSMTPCSKYFALSSNVYHIYPCIHIELFFTSFYVFFFPNSKLKTPWQSQDTSKS